MSAASIRPRDSAGRWIGWAAAALLLVVFLSQLPFFFAWGSHFPLSYAFNYGWALVVLLVVTSFTRTVSLRLLAAAWFVGVYVVIGAMLLVGLPFATVFGLGAAVIPGFILPLTEELIKPIPILLLFWWVARRGLWQLSATDGMVVGFMIGAGAAFHEDMMFGRVFGSGPGETPLSWLFPTIFSFRGVMGSYHELWLALIGLAIGAAFLLRQRTRLAWILPVAAWLVVFTDHWTWNYIIDPNAGEPFLALATGLRGVLLDGALVPILLVLGLALTLGAELALLRVMGNRDRLFRSVGVETFIGALRDLPQGGWRRLQALREYARLRRAAHYAIWATETRGAAPAADVMAARLAGLAIRAGLAPGQGGEHDSTRAAGSRDATDQAAIDS